MVFAIVFISLVFTVTHYSSEGCCRFLDVFLILCFFIIIFSDVIDGYMARKMSAVSDIGAKLDLAADFIYVIGTVSILVYGNVLQVWFPLVLLLNFFAFLVTSKILVQNKNLKAFTVFDKIGKLATNLTMLLPSVFIFRFIIPNHYESVMQTGVFIITGLFCISFFYRIILIMRTKHEKDAL
jgi:CDP-diacylglycerol--glycerol-3-phosphate 3-phosphatidyltransferase/cardiolipin synthase